MRFREKSCGRTTRANQIPYSCGLVRDFKSTILPPQTHKHHTGTHMTSTNPRSFAGQRDASVIDFMTAYCIDLSLGDDPTPLLEKAKEIAKLAAKSGATDLGAWMAIDREVVGRHFEHVNGDRDWVGPIEDTLHMTFRVYTPEHNVASQARQAEAKSRKRKDRFEEYDQGSFGARMHAEDNLKDITFCYEDFPNVQTQNPRHCAITDKEFHYIKDVVRVAMTAK